MTTPAGWYADPHNHGQLRWWDGLRWTQQVSALPASSTTPPARHQGPGDVTTPSKVHAPPGVADQPRAQSGGPKQALQQELAQLRGELVETRAQMLLQEVGLYEYSHPLDSSANYKTALAELRQEAKERVRSGNAVSSTKRWAINGSDKEGMKMVTDFGKLMLRSYNSEAETLVKSLRPYGLESGLKRLSKARTTISKLCQSMHIEITDEYHALRETELELTADYLQKVAEEKEAAREERARLREEAAARKDFEREQAKLEKEQSHYESAIAALRARGDEAAAAEAELKLGEIQRALQGVLDRSANVRAGYVYVISNLGAFGPDVVKIGMTRRLEPMDRVRELGDASVPFRFDVHAIIFSEDAVSLENTLHKKFSEVRLNLVNQRREFFRTTPAQVKEALQELRGDLLTFTENADAPEWNQSEAERRHRTEPKSPTEESPHPELV